MGELYIERPNGEVTKIGIDGTVVNEQKPINIDWCDKCQRWQGRDFGRFQQSDGISILWFCEACK